MSEKAIFAIEEALLSTLITQKALVELLIKKNIIKREELEKIILGTDIKKTGIGKARKRLFLLKRSKKDRRQIAGNIRTERRNIIRRNGI